MARDITPKKPRAWQRMLSGRRLDLLDPAPLDVEIEDIAHGIARVARWNGQTHGEHAFSVAQHSVVVLEICRALKPKLTTDQALSALLHDAPEYVVGDLISPFKAAVGLDYKRLEGRLQQAIHIRFGLPGALPEAWTKLIKKADVICAFYEAVALAGFEEAEALKIFGSPGSVPRPDLTPLPATQAQAQYLDIFRSLFETHTREDTPSKTRQTRAK